MKFSFLVLRFKSCYQAALLPVAVSWCLLLQSKLLADEKTAVLPPTLPWSGYSEALIVNADDPWVTPCELTGLTDTPRYDETMAWLKKLADASPMIAMVSFGKTAEGRDLYAMIVTKEGIDDLALLGNSTKPTVLAQAGIHSGEIDGKDAGMMLLRDIAFRGKASLLDRANLLFVPIFNADGHERTSEWNRPNQRGPVHQGWRTTAQNLNLNRDYMKAQAPEMQGMLRLIQVTKPSLYLDIHVTDGVDYQYDITFGFHGSRKSFAWSTSIASWLDEVYRPRLDTELKSAGHIPGPLVFATNDRDLADGISDGPSNPRFSTGYGDLIHLPSILVENHSLKPYRQRVLGTYVLIESSLRIAGDHTVALRQAIDADRKGRPSKLGVNWSEAANERLKIEFLGIASEDYVSPASGESEVRWLGKPVTYPELTLNRVTRPDVVLSVPKAYYVPVTSPEVIDVLESHGIEFERLKESRVLELDAYRLVNPIASAKPNEGRHTLKTGVRAETAQRTVPSGTLRVSTDQPLGNLVVALLEPEHVDSLAAWGFFPGILQRTEYMEGYVIAPMAEKLLQENADLKAEFEAKLAADPAFAKNSTARLQWFYERTPYYDEKYLLYPVLIER